MGGTQVADGHLQRVISVYSKMRMSSPCVRERQSLKQTDRKRGREIELRRVVLVGN